jgi:hypothetical protein
MTFAETLDMTSRTEVATLSSVSALDFRSPFDELTELRSILTTLQIAELTGLRRETISRARPDSRFQRRTEKALGDLYAVVTQIRSVNGGDLGQLAAVLRRPQPLLADRSIAQLLKEGRVDVVLEHLAPPVPTQDEPLRDLRLDPEMLARLSATADPDRTASVPAAAAEGRGVAALLDADMELASLLPAIEARIHHHFGADATIERTIITDHDAPESGDELYLRIRTSLDHDEEVDRLIDLLREESDLLEPVRARLTIGTL